MTAKYIDRTGSSGSSAASQWRKVQKAAVTQAPVPFIAERELVRDLFGQLGWDADVDCKKERSRAKASWTIDRINVRE